MLDFFRHKGLSNVIYGAVIVATIFAFVITFRPSSTQKVASLAETCVARVRGRCVDPKEFGASYRMIARGGPRKLHLKQAAIDGIVERELLVDEAKRIGVGATDEELTEQLFDGYVRFSVPAADPSVAAQILGSVLRAHVGVGNMPQNVAQTLFNERESIVWVDFRDSSSKQFDLKVYDRRVKEMSGRSTGEFREQQAKELVAAKMRNLVRDPVRVSEAEAWQQYQGQHSTANVTWIPVKESWAARWAVDVKQTDVDAWVKAHAGDFDAAFEERKKEDAPQEGHIRHILVKLPYGATDDEKAQGLARLSWAAARIKGGESFAEVAREMSDDTGSAMKGGDVGAKTDGFVTPFKVAAGALKAGEATAGAVETQFGYHYIAKDDPAKATDVEAAVRKSVARSLYAKSKATDAAKDLATKIDDLMRAGKSAADAIKEVVDPLVREEKITMLGVLPAPAEADGGAAADAGKPAAPKDAKDSSADRRFDASTDADKPATQTSSAFNRGGDPFPGLSPDGTAKIVQFAFASKDGAVLGEPVRTMGAFVVVQLKQHEVATREAFDKDRESFEEDLLRSKRDEALSLYVKRLREAAKDDIKVEQAFVEEAKPDGGTSSAPDEEEEY